MTIPTNMNPVIAKIADVSGQRWFEESLGNGFDPSAAILAATLLEGGSFYTFVPLLD